MDIDVTFRLSRKDDLPIVEEIRQKAFAPVFASFRSILGKEIYELAQQPEDKKQGGLLRSMFLAESEWRLYLVEVSGEVIGFVSIRLGSESKVGEIGLNAVRPDCCGKGIGTEMYKFATSKMKESGMRVATVATGSDISHAPARRAYERSGFNVKIPSLWMCQSL